MIYIITGKSNAGKTHTAKALKKDLENENRKVFWFDGDIWRSENNNNNFTLDGRFSNISSAVKKAKEIEKEYDDIIFSFIMPDKELRKYIRKSFNESVTLYIPGGKIWPGTVYEMPDPQEMGYFKND